MAEGQECENLDFNKKILILAQVLIPFKYLNSLQPQNVGPINR